LTQVNSQSQAARRLYSSFEENNVPAQPAQPAQPTELAFSALKRQMATALQLTEVLVEATEKAREIQLTAAVEAHAALDATRKAIEGAATLPEILELQSRLATQNLSKVMAYWSSLAGSVQDTQMRLAAILGGGAKDALPPDLLPGLYAAAAGEKAAEEKAA
jgi:hypothetical protein